MNNSVPDWNFGSDSCVTTTNQKKPMIEVDQELVELLWQNGQVVLHSQTHRKPVVNSITPRPLQRNFQSTLRTSEPFGNSSNLIQDDETVSWIQYPLEDPLEQEFCSNLLSELAPCEVESYKQIKPFEEGKFTKLDASSAPNVTVTSQSPTMKSSSFQEYSGIPIPAPRFHVSDSPQKNNNDLGGSCKVQNFSHFSAPLNVSSASANEHFRDKITGNMSKNDIRECSLMTVGSSYCGSNHIPQDPDASKASSNGVWTTTLSAEPEAVRDHVPRTIPQNEKGKSEMLEPTATSSSGGSGSSLGKNCSLSTRNQGQKRKGIDVEESEEQSEDTELKSALGNKSSQRAGLARRNRAAAVHNLSERKRRDRINEKMKALQQLIPHSNKTDKASMLEEAIEYLKSLQLQLQLMWMGSGMAPMMFPGFQHYMSQMGMGMATPPFPPIHNPMQLPRVPPDQSVSASQTPNQTLMSQNPILGAFNYQNQMQNPALSEQYARYMGYHLMQNASQPMNVFRYGPQGVRQSQTMITPRNSSGNMSGAANVDEARTVSAQSSDNKFSSLRSYNSVSLVDFFSEPVQASEPLQNKAFGIPRPPGSTRSVSMDRSKAPLESASSVDLFQLPAAPQAPTVDLFQSSVSSAAPSFNENQLPQTSQLASIDFFAEFSEQPSTVTSDGKALELSVPKNEGWATFDMPQSTSSTAQVEIPGTVPSSAKSLPERFDPFSTSNAKVQWSSFEISSVNVPSSVTSNLWHDGVWNGEEQVSAMTANTKPWNAFEDSGGHHPVDALRQELQLHNFLSADNHILGLIESEGSNEDEVKGIAPVGRFDNHDIPSHVSGSAYPPPMLPPMGDIQHNETKSKSTNPFDYPYESDVDHKNMFVDMSSLQAALPDALFPATFHGGIAESWLPQNTVTSYISSAGEGGLSFMAMQSPSSQIQNIQIGGNPFA